MAMISRGLVLAGSSRYDSLLPCNMISRESRVLIQMMLKAFMPVAVYSLIVSFHTDSFRRASMLNMLGISAGVAVAVAAYGEARFDAFGVMLQLTAVAAEATWLVLIQILVTSNGKSLNPHHLALLSRRAAKAAPPWLAANDVVTAVTAAGRRLPTPSSLVGLLPTLTSLRKEMRERRKGEKKRKSKGCDMETLTCRAHMSRTEDEKEGKTNKDSDTSTQG
uniref:Sugar phosphate transporter domain-containing protein n=1 Tax=Oryza rufipogon TaxID=4529 RepID=A0A0E0NTX8_ORYRU